MITFSMKVKREVCENLSDNNNVLSEVVGIVKSRAEINVDSNGKFSFNISMDNEDVINYIRNIFLNNFLKYSLRIYIEQCRLKNSYSLKVVGDKIHHLLVDLGIINKYEDFIKFDNDIELKVFDFKSFMRGVFISCGSIANPEKSYHLEFVLQDLDFSNYLVKFLNFHGFASKLIKRRYCYVIYMKEADKICEFLNILGANDRVLDFESIRVIKEYSNNKNRIKNCIEANEDKLIIASVKQVRCILLIKNCIGLNKLPEKLREIAELRLKNKEMSLKDLGMLLKPPLGKSGVLHRLKKIEKIAKELEN